MITKEDCYCGTCDNCGEIFNDGEYSMFPLDSDVKDRMKDSEWYVGEFDDEYKGMHFCPDCFEHDENIDDKIVIDLIRKKELPIQSGERGEVERLRGEIEFLESEIGRLGGLVYKQKKHIYEK